MAPPLAELIERHSLFGHLPPPPPPRPLHWRCDDRCAKKREATRETASKMAEGTVPLRRSSIGTTVSAANATTLGQVVQRLARESERALVEELEPRTDITVVTVCTWAEQAEGAPLAATTRAAAGLRKRAAATGPERWRSLCVGLRANVGGYVRAHGHGLLFFGSNLAAPRPVSWAKLVALAFAANVRHSKLSFWTDADTRFMTPRAGVGLERYAPKEGSHLALSASPECFASTSHMMVRSGASSARWLNSVWRAHDAVAPNVDAARVPAGGLEEAAAVWLLGGSRPECASGVDDGDCCDLPAEGDAPADVDLRPYPSMWVRVQDYSGGGERAREVERSSVFIVHLAHDSRVAGNGTRRPPSRTGATIAPSRPNPKPGAQHTAGASPASEPQRAWLPAGFELVN